MDRTGRVKRGNPDGTPPNRDPTVSIGRSPSHATAVTADEADDRAGNGLEEPRPDRRHVAD